MAINLSLVKEPLVSIIITYYNLWKYIHDCVFSILNQEYKNFEIIIVNDNSDEKNFKILKKISAKNLKIINLEKNKGQLGAFLEGLKIAQGEFICTVDADDILLPDYLKTLLYVHLNNNVAFVSSSGGEINQKNELTSLNSKNNQINKQADRIFYRQIQNLYNQNESFEINFLDIKSLPFAQGGWNPSSSAMIRKEALEILKYYSDVNFWKTGADKVIFSLLHLIGGSANISAVCYLYRHHDSNNFKTTLSTGNKKYLCEDYVKKIILWNKKIRLDSIKMFIKNKNSLIEKYNKINYLKMLYRIIFCINLKTCAKIIKTFAHEIINI